MEARLSFNLVKVCPQSFVHTKGTLFLVKLFNGLAIRLNSRINRSIEITKSQKRLNFFHCSGYSPILNDFCVAGVGFNPVRGDNESEVFCSLDVKFTFVNRRLQPCLTQFIQHFLDMFLVLDLIITVDEISVVRKLSR